MRTPDPVLGAGAWLLENGHRCLLKLTGGRFPRKVLGMMKTVELHTTGRKSGTAYSTMLTTAVHDEQRIVLVASKGGSQDHPTDDQEAAESARRRVDQLRCCESGRHSTWVAG